ncbi:MAG TPA: MFS transporter [Gammaproteobacteria bacterium]|nr:MFS transporter [Gammaproteobacteria bacterium]
MSSRHVFTPILIAASLVLLISFAIRASFGVFQIPIANDLGWFRTEFSLAIAIQNLAWGIATPLFGAFAEKLGDRKAVVVGVLVYALGLALSAMASTATSHQLLEILVGVGIAGTGFGVILGVVGRAASDETRSLALGITTAAGSAGQIGGPPLTQYLLNATTWQTVFLMYAGVILLALLALPFMKAPPRVSAQGLEQSLSKILNVAVRDPSYALIFIGFFSCGFQLAFVTAHFPAFVTEACATIDPNGILAKMGVRDTADLGAVSIAVIGIFNIIGTVTAGALGGRYSKRLLLAWIYLGRTVLSAWFILMPMTPTTVLVFSAVMGSLWLATVPLTSGLVAYIYGLKYMGTLYGLVFLSHQIGSFVGVWLGGDFYDRFGSYEIVWWVGVGTGLLSAIVHLPVKEMPYQSREQAA